MHQLLQLFAWSLGIFIFCTQSAAAQSFNFASSCRPQFVLSEEFVPGEMFITNENCADPQRLLTTPPIALLKLITANVVYLGETHDNPKDHQIQLEIIQSLQRQNPKMAIAMEMFQRPYQDVLNRYVAGQISEADLLASSEYNRRWGFPWEYYAPIVRFAKQENLPILALNTPTEVTHQVARAGLENLTPQQQQHIPPVAEIRTDNQEYRQMVLDAFKQHQQASHGASLNFERFFLAQVLWDETMAESIAEFVKSHPEYQVVVLAGQGHIIYGYGIPSRVARRFHHRQLHQRSILLSPSESITRTEEKPVADFIWLD